MQAAEERKAFDTVDHVAVSGERCEGHGGLVPEEFQLQSGVSGRDLGVAGICEYTRRLCAAATASATFCAAARSGAFTASRKRTATAHVPFISAIRPEMP